MVELLSDVELTKLQEEFYGLFANFLEKKGDNPLLGEIYATLLTTGSPLLQKDLVKMTDKTTSTISRALKALEEDGLVVKTRSSSRSMLYSTNPTSFFKLFEEPFVETQNQLKNLKDQFIQIRKRWDELKEVTKRSEEASRLADILNELIEWASVIQEEYSSFLKSMNDRVQRIEERRHTKAILDTARHWCFEHYLGEKQVATRVVLAGSWARGTARDTNDIDIFLISDELNGDTMVRHEEHVLDEFTLDVWLYKAKHFKQMLTKWPKDLNDIHDISLILSFLRDARVWHDPGHVLDEFIEKAKEWEWNAEYKKYLEINAEVPTVQWARKAYEEDLEILRAAGERLDRGRPISHRRKDYDELTVEVDEQFTAKVRDLTLKAYTALEIRREWTELSDAKKAFNLGRWGNALASLKDVLRFLVRQCLGTDAPPIRLDPGLWSKAEKASLHPALLEALRAAFP